MRDRFWEKYSLGELNGREWEALCDGCGQCCLKLRVENSEVTVYGVACELLDIGTARCKDYANRLRRVPTCHELTPTSVPMYQGWLPESCAYVRVHKGQALPAWHPLLAGTATGCTGRGSPSATTPSRAARCRGGKRNGTSSRAGRSARNASSREGRRHRMIVAGGRRTPLHAASGNRKTAPQPG